MLNEIINAPIEWAKEYAREVGRNMGGLNSFYNGIFTGPKHPLAYAANPPGVAGGSMLFILASMPVPYAVGLLEPLVETPIRQSAKFRTAAVSAGASALYYLFYPICVGAYRIDNRKMRDRIFNEKNMVALIVGETALNYFFLADMVGIDPVKAALGTVPIRSLEYLLGLATGLEQKRQFKELRDQKSRDDSIKDVPIDDMPLDDRVR